MKWQKKNKQLQQSNYVTGIQFWDEVKAWNNKVLLQYYLPENIAVIGKGACPLLVLNIYSIQLVALQSFASFPHSSDKAFTLLDGAWTSLQALYMAEKRKRKEALRPLVTELHNHSTAKVYS